MAVLFAPASDPHAQDVDASLGEQVMQVPAGGVTDPELEVTVYRLPGAGPFPVVVINHGRASGNAKLQPRYRPGLAAREFLRRGYAVVVPMRVGFSKSGGHEVSGGCNVFSNGEQQAQSVRRTLDWVATQRWADVSRNVVVGQSHGGLTTLAYGMSPHPGTKLLVNFAGGLKQTDCTAWQFGLISAFADYGAKTTLPSLWFYGDNDSYFPVWVWRQAHERYVQAGGKAELVAFGSFANDSHGMFSSSKGLAIWVPLVMAAFDKVGLPTAIVAPLPEAPDIVPPAASGYASTDEIDKLPVRGERGRELYRTWLAQDRPRAFAIHADSGAVGWAAGGSRPFARALANCERYAKAPCTLYAIDDTVVWTPEPSRSQVTPAAQAASR